MGWIPRGNRFYHRQVGKRLDLRMFPIGRRYSRKNVGKVRRAVFIQPSKDLPAMAEGLDGVNNSNRINMVLENIIFLLSRIHIDNTTFFDSSLLLMLL